MAEWPDGTALTGWIGSNVSTESEARFDEIVEAATDWLKGRLDASLLPEDDSCPPSVRQAILIEAARIHTRTQNAAGVISFGDFATGVNRNDPDVDRLISRYRVTPDP